MNNIILDTNIISEFAKPAPEPKVVNFTTSLPEVWISSLTLHELEYGILLLPDGKRKTHLKNVIDNIINSYGDCVLPINRPEALQAAILRVSAAKSGRILQLADSLIAGTAKEHNLTIATRNTSDFEGLDIPLINPWD